MITRHRAFRRLVGLYLCGRVSMDLTGAMLILYVTHVLGRTADFEPMMLGLVVSVAACMPLWLWVSRRSEKSRVFCIGAVWWACVQLVFIFAQPEWPRWIVLAVPPLLGIGYAAVDLMPWAMVGEVVDEDDCATGERREGIYYGCFTLLRKLAGTIAVWLALSLLGVLGLERGEEQSASVLLGIRLLAGLGPAVFLLAALWFARGYPLTRARHAQILAELEARDGPPRGS